MVSQKNIEKYEFNSLGYAVMLKCENCKDFPVAIFLDEYSAKKFTKKHREIYYVINLNEKLPF